MRPKNTELLKHREKQLILQPSLQALRSASELGHELLQLLQPQAQPCHPRGGSCLCLALAFSLFFCNINNEGNMKVASTIKSSICAAPRAEPLQQHLSAMPVMMLCPRHHQRPGWWLGLEPSTPHPMRSASIPASLREESAGDKPHSCGSSSRSSTAAETVAAWVWHYRLAENWKKRSCHVCQAILTDHPRSAACPGQWGGAMLVHIATVNSSILTWKDYAHFKLLHAAPANQHFFILQITLCWFQRGLRSSFIAVGKKR